MAVVIRAGRLGLIAILVSRRGWIVGASTTVAVLLGHVCAMFNIRARRNLAAPRAPAATYDSGS